MMNENAIYNAKLTEIADNLQQLNEIDIDTENTKKIIETIKQTVEQKKEECYVKNDGNIFLNDLIANIYRDAVAKLENINKSLIKEYQEFYILNQTFLELKSKKISESTIEEIVREIKNLLNKMLLSTQCSENSEKFLLKIYEFTYSTIKFEIIYKGKSILLDFAKTSQVHITYIAKCIKTEIKKISKNNNVKEKLVEINKNGFDDIHYLNEELLFLIIKNSKKEYHSILDDHIENSYKEYDEVKQNIKTAKEKQRLHITNIKDTKKKRNQLWKKQVARKALFFLNLGIVGVSTFAVIKLSNKIPPNKEYKTITTFYDSSNPNAKEEKVEYQKKANNELSLTEYSPWEKPGYFREEYQRNVYTYAIDDLEIRENVEDYLNENLKDKIILSDASIETSADAPTENYTKNKYVISQIYQNEEDYQEVEDKTGKMFFRVIFIGIIMMLDALIALYYISKREENLKGKIKNEKTSLLSQKQLLLEEKQKINTLTEQLNSLKAKLNNQYEILPKALQEDEEIQKRIRKLNEISEDE